MQVTEAVRDSGKVAGVPPMRLQMMVIKAIIEGRTELWFHPDQMINDPVRSDVIQRHLEENPNILAGCVRVYELQDIHDEGIDFFRRYFAGMTIYGRAIPPGATRISFLCESCERMGKLLLGWVSPDAFLFGNSPALRVLE